MTPASTDAARRCENGQACIEALDEAFAQRTLAEWKEALADASGVWAVYQEPGELHDDPQALENGYLSDVVADDGNAFTLVASPVQFDEAPAELTARPNTESTPRRSCSTWASTGTTSSA